MYGLENFAGLRKSESQGRIVDADLTTVLRELATLSVWDFKQDFTLSIYIMNIFKIMIATDNHLGYQEKDELRKHDSFLAVEEILQESLKHESDFLLLGGDLFHEHNPSTYTLNRTLQLFGENVLGSREILFETLSNGRELNYLNPSLHIKLPVFIIHGNHDDPSSDTSISAINLMHSAHYLNYVTCESQEEGLYVRPVVLRKNGTIVAIYGLGNIKEERLSRLLKADQVVFERTQETCFCILLVHQNRFKGHGTGAPAKNCIMDWMFPEFIDIIIWGHEHDSFIEHRKTQNREYVIYQPGSTVATSLTEGEARLKHMLFLEIRNLGYKITPIPIKNTRRILFRNLELKDIQPSPTDIEGFVSEIFEEMIKEGNVVQKLVPPLVRIKIEVSGFEHFRAFFLNSKLSERTANKDIVVVWKRTSKEKTEEKTKSKENGIITDILQILNTSLSNADNEFKIYNIEHFIESVDDFAIKKHTKAVEIYYKTKVDMAISQIKSSTTYFDEDLIKKKIKDLDISDTAPNLKRFALPIKSEKKLKKP